MATCLQNVAITNWPFLTLVWTLVINTVVPLFTQSFSKASASPQAFNQELGKAKACAFCKLSFAANVSLPLGDVQVCAGLVAAQSGALEHTGPRAAAVNSIHLRNTSYMPGPLKRPRPAGPHNQPIHPNHLDATDKESSPNATRNSQTRLWRWDPATCMGI